MFDVNQLVINRPIRGMMLTNAGDMAWQVSDFKDPHLTANTETQTAVDALNTPIMEFDRAKTVEFSATKANFDLGLVAARSGMEKKKATSAAPITVPKWETVTVAKDTATVTLEKTPAGANPIPFIWELGADGYATTRYSVNDADASETEFTLAGQTLTLPTGRTGDKEFLIIYEYAADGTAGNGAVEVDYSANNFPKGGKFVMSALAHTVCDTETEYFVWIIMDNAKLSSNLDLTLNPEMTDTFTLKAMPKYCSEDKRCFRIIVPEVA